MVVIGFLGTVLDSGAKDLKRWHKWRPTVSLCQHEHMQVDRLELLINGNNQALAEIIANDIKQISPETTVKFNAIALKDPWDFQEVFGVLHEFAKSYDFDLEHEEYFMHITTGTHVAQICMFLLTEAKYFPAKLLQSSPPRHSQDGPGHYTIIDLDVSKYDLIAQRFEKEQQDATSFLKLGIQTKNKIFNDVIEQIEKVASITTSPILIMGPTGAGKSQLAQRIYELKKIRHQIKGAFVEVNCATLKGDMAMSTLFGHRKGAFTGAIHDRSGLLSTANMGVLFLDEIGELGLDEQAMILRAIEEKKFLPVGADKEISSNFQLLAGTNKNLANEVTKGNFREDLWARLNLWTFHLPGLKDRREDIEPNIEYELKQYANEHVKNISFNKEAREKYLDFCLSSKAIWSSNFRDLSGSINRLATLAQGGRIKVNDVTEEIKRLQRLWHVSVGDSRMQLLNSILSEEEIHEIDLFDRLQLAAVIEICRHERSLSEAGRVLFSNTRTKKKTVNDADRLSKYLQRFNLSWTAIKG
ncbi:MAG: RNA repair transcriptional activator RtcR [Pseudomonadota bacterium]